MKAQSQRRIHVTENQVELLDAIFDRVDKRWTIYVGRIRELCLSIEATARLLEFLKNAGYTLDMKNDEYNPTENSTHKKNQQEIR